MKKYRSKYIFSNTIFPISNYHIIWKNSFGADWPNTYTFTKALAENDILSYENQLPISIFRPSISKDLKYANM